jgi:hypothetical protein
MEKILFRQAIAQKIFVSALISRNTRIQIYDGAFSPPLMRELYRSPSGMPERACEEDPHGLSQKRIFSGRRLLWSEVLQVETG